MNLDFFPFLNSFKTTSLGLCTPLGQYSCFKMSYILSRSYPPSSCQQSGQPSTLGHFTARSFASPTAPILL